jgi:hypothetical protein
MRLLFWLCFLSSVWIGGVAFFSLLYAAIDVERGRVPYWRIWWGYFSHAVLFRRWGGEDHA